MTGRIGIWSNGSATSLTFLSPLLPSSASQPSYWSLGKIGARAQESPHERLLSRMSLIGFTHDILYERCGDYIRSAKRLSLQQAERQWPQNRLSQGCKLLCPAEADCYARVSLYTP